MQSTTPISRIMTRKPETVKPSDTMEDVRRIFEKRGFHHIPVLDQGKWSVWFLTPIIYS